MAVTANRVVKVPMRTLAAGNKISRHTQTGLSLIELLVVLIILALVSGVAMMSLPDQRTEAQDVAKRFAAHVAMLTDQAIVEGRPYGIVVTPGGWQARAFDGGQWVYRPLPNSMQVLEDVTLTFTERDSFELPEPEEQGVVQLRTPGGSGEVAPPPTPPSITFDPVGERTPFDLEVVGRDEVWIVSADVLGEIEVRRADQ